MPKKHQRNFKIYQTHGHSPQTSNSSSSPTSSSKTVNERLEQLRKEQVPRMSVQKTNEMVAVTTQKTVPPQLREILNMPETTPPQPRPGARPPRNRRTPGPAPPPSWLAASRHMPLHVAARNKERLREEQDKAGLRKVPPGFSRLATLEDKSPVLPPRRSLMHQAIRKMAENWESLSEYEQYNLAALPASLKSLLLSYLSVYSSDQGIDIDSLKVLFLTDAELEGGSGGAGLELMDLTGLLSFGLSLIDLQRYFLKPIEPMSPSRIPPEDGSVVPTDGRLEEPHNSLRILHPDRDLHFHTLLDSWEDEASNSASGIPRHIAMSRFPDLCRLSLAHAGAFASWRDLLSLTHHLPLLTHLSLAYWPAPTMTPNSRAAFIETRHARVNVSGTHIYSQLDQDWHEAANILRRLSNNTYCLEWLDLEGCTEWVPALTFRVNHSAGSNRGRWVDRTFDPSSPSTFEEEFLSTEGLNINWSGSWGQVTYVNVAQGCMPTNLPWDNRPKTGIRNEVMWYVSQQDEHVRSQMEERWRASAPLIGGELQWLEREQNARLAERQVREIRRARGGFFCHFDYGWEVPSFSTAQREGS